MRMRAGQQRQRGGEGGGREGVAGRGGAEGGEEKKRGTGCGTMKEVPLLAVWPVPGVWWCGVCWEEERHLRTTSFL